MGCQVTKPKISQTLDGQTKKNHFNVNLRSKIALQTDTEDITAHTKQNEANQQNCQPTSPLSEITMPSGMQSPTPSSRIQKQFAKNQKILISSAEKDGSDKEADQTQQPTYLASTMHTVRSSNTKLTTNSNLQVPSNLFPSSNVSNILANTASNMPTYSLIDTSNNETLDKSGNNANQEPAQNTNFLGVVRTKKRTATTCSIQENIEEKSMVKTQNDFDEEEELPQKFPSRINGSSNLQTIKEENAYSESHSSARSKVNMVHGSGNSSPTDTPKQYQQSKFGAKEAVKTYQNLNEHFPNSSAQQKGVVESKFTKNLLGLAKQPSNDQQQGDNEIQKINLLSDNPNQRRLNRNNFLQIDTQSVEKQKTIIIEETTPGTHHHTDHAQPQNKLYSETFSDVKHPKIKQNREINPEESKRPSGNTDFASKDDTNNSSSMHNTSNRVVQKALIKNFDQVANYSQAESSFSKFSEASPSLIINQKNSDISTIRNQGSSNNLIGSSNAFFPSSEANVNQGDSPGVLQLPNNEDPKHQYVHPHQFPKLNKMEKQQSFKRRSKSSIYQNQKPPDDSPLSPLQEVFSPSSKSKFSNVLETPDSPSRARNQLRTFSHNRGSSPNNMLKNALKRQATAVTATFDDPVNESLNESHVIETSRIEKSIDDLGQKCINEYIVIKMLGQGACGKVKLVSHQKTGELYALKIINKARLKTKKTMPGQDPFKQIKTEIEIMKKIDHQNLVKLHEVIDDPEFHKIYLVMDFCEKGALHSKTYWQMELNKPNLKEEDCPKQIEEEKARKYFQQLALGIDYMHNHAHIVHRDIKPDNLLVSKDDTLKVSDFGISHVFEHGKEDELRDTKGTKLFMAPETFVKGPFRGMPVDIWAMGATLYYMLIGVPPFKSSNLQKLKQMVVNEPLSYPKDLKLSNELKHLLERCLDKDPKQRITITQVLMHPWVTKNGEEPVYNKTAEEQFWDTNYNEQESKMEIFNSMIVDQAE